jgi:hypothetical protein
VTATGFCFGDTYQVVARKTLRHLCQIYEGPIACTPMRFFPPWDKNRRVWRPCKVQTCKRTTRPWCT